MLCVILLPVFNVDGFLKLKLLTNFWNKTYSGRKLDHLDFSEAGKVKHFLFQEILLLDFPEARIVL